MLRSLIAAAVVLACMAAPARAELVTVPTAAGIDITVASDVAGKFQGFIRDIVSRGYKPRQIHCFARGGHVRHSKHYSGRACDFDQRGWGLTAGFMYHVRSIASKWGLRDGCEFADWGHIDAGRSYRKACASRLHHIRGRVHHHRRQHGRAVHHHRRQHRG